MHLSNMKMNTAKRVAFVAKGEVAVEQFDLLGQGRFDLEGLNAHRFAGDDAADACRMMNERRGETMGLLLDWSGS